VVIGGGILILMDDNIGKTFERLTIIKRVENDKFNRKVYLCVCDCDCDGKIKAVPLADLKSGKVKSCGCLAKENAFNLFKKYNTYDLSGEYGIGYTLKEEEFYFDLEDYDLIKNYCWHISYDGYIQSRNEDRIIIIQHRIILNVNKDKIVDHINHNKYDNRKINLRECVYTENSANQLKAKNNTSGTKGVSFDKKMNKWHARIGINNKRINLGYYDDIQDAIDVRKEAEDKYQGKFKYIEVKI